MTKFPTPRLALLVAATLGAAITCTDARTFHVDSSIVGQGDGSSWGRAFPLLQDAIAVAGVGDTIHVAAGVYYPDEGVGQTDNDRDSTFLPGKSVTILGGFPPGGGTRDPRANVTILSGDLQQDDVDVGARGIAETPADIVGMNAYNVVTAASTMMLDGFTITAGVADGTGDAAQGGALFIDEQNVVVRNCHFAGNHCVGRGGAVHLSRVATRFVSCTFAGNTSLNRGGAIGTVLDAEPIVINCALWGNSAPRGGAINFNDTVAEVINCSISGNAGTVNGGGIQAAAGSSVKIYNTVIWNNSASGSTASAGASLNFISSSTNSVVASVIENSGGADPLFLIPPDPANAPSALGYLDIGDGSAAIDVGNNGLNPEMNDLLGRTRITGSQIDAGAYEYHGSPVWYVDSTATGSANGSSWTNAFMTLQDALAVAVTGDAIHVAAGAYVPDEGAGATENDRTSTFLLPEGLQLMGGFPAGGGVRNVALHTTVLSGDIDENDIDLDGNSIAEDTAQINGSNAYHVVSILPGSLPTTISGFTITAGMADDGSNTFIFSIDEPSTGGGVVGLDANVRIEDSSFIGNIALRGGGAYLDNHTIELERCSFLSNTVPSGSRGGAGAEVTGESLTIADCVFDQNRIDGGGGGAALRVDGNGIHVGACAIRDSIFTRNVSATRSSGISIGTLASITIDRCDFRGNGEDRQVGEVLRSFRTPSFIVRDSLFAGNQCNYVIENSSQSFLTMLNCTITANNARAIANFGDMNFPSGTVSLGNCIIGNNDGSFQVSSDPAKLFRSHSLIENFPADGDGNLDGTSDFPARLILDPGFVDPRSDHEAPTIEGDYTVLPSSPLIDAGLNSSTASVLDLVGNDRYIDGLNNGTATVDIGAYEREPIPEGDFLRIVDIDIPFRRFTTDDVILTIEVYVRTPYTLYESRDMTPGSWEEITSGLLDPGTHTIVVEWFDFDRNANDLFFRATTP